MRTTLTLDDDLAKTLKERAHQNDEPFKAVVNRTLRAGLEALDAPAEPQPYRLQPASLGRLAPGVDLDKALRLAESLEDEALALEHGYAVASADRDFQRFPEIRHVNPLA